MSEKFKRKSSDMRAVLSLGAADGSEFATREEVIEIIDILVTAMENAKPDAVDAAVSSAKDAAEKKIRIVSAEERKNMRTEIDAAIAAIKLKRGEPGLPGKNGVGLPGKPGRPGRDAEVDYDYIIDSVYSKFDQPENGKDGSIPDHQWDGTKIRFQRPDGFWGPWVDLQGPNGTSFSIFGGGNDSNGAGGVEKILSNGVVVREGAASINFGNNLTVTRSGNGVRVDGPSGGSGVNVATEKVTPAQSGNNITLDLTTLAHTFIAVLLVTRQGQVLLPATDFSQGGNTITVFNADAASESFLVQYTY